MKKPMPTTKTAYSFFSDGDIAPAHTKNLVFRVPAMLLTGCGGHVRALLLRKIRPAREKRRNTPARKYCGKDPLVSQTYSEELLPLFKDISIRFQGYIADFVLFSLTAPGNGPDRRSGTVCPVRCRRHGAAAGRSFFCLPGGAEDWHKERAARKGREAFFCEVVS